MDLAALDTPVATVDLDAVERTIALMQGYCDEHGLPSGRTSGLWPVAARGKLR